jgi:hypothetical protein
LRPKRLHTVAFPPSTDAILDHQFGKNSSLFLHDIQILADFTENQTLLWFKNPLKKNPRKKKTLFINSILLNGKTKVENPDKDSSLCPENSTKKAVQECHLRSWRLARASLHPTAGELSKQCRKAGIPSFSMACMGTFVVYKATYARA